MMQSKEEKSLTRGSIEQLQTKKRRQQKDAEDVEKEADELAAATEQKRDLMCVTKSTVCEAEAG